MPSSRSSQPALDVNDEVASSDAFDERPTGRLALVGAEIVPGMWVRERRYGCIGLVVRATDSGRVHLTLFSANGEPALDWVTSDGDLARCDPPPWARQRRRRS